MAQYEAVAMVARKAAESMKDFRAATSTPETIPMTDSDTEEARMAADCIGMLREVSAVLARQSREIETLRAALTDAREFVNASVSESPRWDYATETLLKIDAALSSSPLPIRNRALEEAGLSLQECYDQGFPADLKIGDEVYTGGKITAISEVGYIVRNANEPAFYRRALKSPAPLEAKPKGDDHG